MLIGVVTSLQARCMQATSQKPKVHRLGLGVLPYRSHPQIPDTDTATDSDGASQLTDDLRLSRLSIVVTCFPRRFAGSLEWINKQLDGFVMQSGTFGAAC
jgi:hypothetical protein